MTPSDALRDLGPRLVAALAGACLEYHQNAPEDERPEVLPAFVEAQDALEAFLAEAS